RASVVPNRHSQLPGSASSSSTAAVAKLAEKKKEFEAVAALERSSAQFVVRTEDLGDDFDINPGATLVVHGKVLQQWPDMFRILDLFLSHRDQRTEGEDASVTTTGERLVRVPIDQLHQTG
ncbi:hypothetical protein K466DRAFT_483535, partial [Polyporus arcularius HHB13444]